MRRSLLAFFAAMMLCAFASAQFGMVGAHSRTTIVMTPEVKKELKITKDQDKKVMDALKGMQDEMQTGKVSFDFANPLASIDAKLDEILDETQKARLEEIYVQVNTGFALTDKKVAAWLGLTEEQNAQVQARNQSASTELMQKAMEMRSNNAVKELKKRKEEIALEFLAILDVTQKEKFEKGKGKIIKIKSIAG